ncbi:DNA ligase-1 [Endobacter medicaginis]|uniref:DNA ligase (ATP) n=1 Tax=Endobacter medicaginis TaxID=1181271 RepID=A0A839UTM9_9PROT|nr:cisplatin damage response ATP-dependent DNA ligase [Endobacter medicaginis]MBB3173618.1 DNA ligase-1 [Endobacter medicaginis]MCX5477042.1 cisplatin damage response ATP-dependent DNA ligase [Endobacter medicaginis]NVN30871.1 cisplatin damage response ATP-dependent DNA ligase [Endobacter medicaginis]
MIAFATLLERLTLTPGRLAKLALLREFFRTEPDPDRGWGLAALTGTLSFPLAKPALIRALAQARTDPVLFEWSCDYVGDLAETVSLIWPARDDAFGRNSVRTPPMLAEVVDGLMHTPKAELPALLEGWLDASDPPVRYAILKLMTGALRVGASARLAKTALAELAGGSVSVDEIEEVWHGLAPPYAELFDWLEARGPRPDPQDAPVFRSPMLAQPLEAADIAALDYAAYCAEWKWDGIRVQLVSVPGGRRIYSRGSDDVSAAFPEIVEAMGFDAVLDGELLVIRDGEVAPFADLQQRLNRKVPGVALMEQHPVAVRLYDLLFEEGEDLRALPFEQRRARLEAWFATHRPPRMDLSAVIEAADFDTLSSLRDGARAASIEGVMLKRRDSPYVAGRPKGLWWKWKRDPLTIDAVVMYAQRGHGKRSSFYSDYTFGLWRDGAEGAELVPVGKAYSGFTDAELAQMDRWIRNNTTRRYGPVREVAPGLVLEIAFDAAQRSNRHKSGVALRFPRVARLRPDKPFEEADRLETLLRLIPS